MWQGGMRGGLIIQLYTYIDKTHETLLTRIAPALVSRQTSNKSDNNLTDSDPFTIGIGGNLKPADVLDGFSRKSSGTRGWKSTAPRHIWRSPVLEPFCISSRKPLSRKYGNQLESWASVKFPALHPDNFRLLYGPESRRWRRW